MNFLLSYYTFEEVKSRFQLFDICSVGHVVNFVVLNPRYLLEEIFFRYSVGHLSSQVGDATVSRFIGEALLAFLTGLTLANSAVLH